MGWIYCPNTVINYPIAHTEDNFTYLDHLLSGEYNANGTIFVDCQDNPDFSGKNTRVYGHNMNDGSMFAVSATTGMQSTIPSTPAST
ncbi:MAG: class B sortase [Oscillospiraceae bacterium]